MSSSPSSTLFASPSPYHKREPSDPTDFGDIHEFSSPTPKPVSLSNAILVKPETPQLPQKHVKGVHAQFHYPSPEEVIFTIHQSAQLEQVSPHDQAGPLPSAENMLNMVYTSNPMGEPLLAHPHMTQATIYVNMFPPDMPERLLADALRGCMPIRVLLKPAVPPNNRLLPNMYYDWMSKTGTIDFTSLPLAERALAILVNHITFTPRGIWFSPYPPPTLLPNPTSSTATRYIRPARMVATPKPPCDPELAFLANFPTPGKVYDAVRPWGSIRTVNTYVTEASEQGKGEHNNHLWLARVEFWYEEEASRFDRGFGQTASLLKGWQIHIHSSMPEPITPVSEHDFQARPPIHIDMPPQTPSSASQVQYLTPIYPVDGNQVIPSMGMMYVPNLSVPSTPTTTMIPNFSGVDHVLMPTSVDFVPPWADHNLFAAVGIIPDSCSDGYFGPTTSDVMCRRLGKASMSSLNGRGRTWSLTVGESSEGDLRPTGLVSDDGTIIQHGPGQHIRPAPAFGPGSNSASGLVDYSNVFVKNLDSDISSYYLEHIFSQFGQVVSARVMRDDEGRSRGYGFVSFYAPEQAASAIALMHNQKVGRNYLSVTLHEPRKLRPEKIAERVAQGLPTSLGRQSAALPRRSMSPVRTDRIGRGRKLHEDVPKTLSTTDQFRSLSPDSRKITLSKQIAHKVRSYAEVNSRPDEHFGIALDSLVQQDLSIIPLLDNNEQLQSRIRNAFTVIDSQVHSGNESKRDFHKQEGTSVCQPKLSQHEQCENQESNSMSECTLVPLEGLDISSFGSLPAKDIIYNLQGEHGLNVLAYLGVIEPTITEKTSNATWAQELMNKSKVVRVVELANVLVKRLDSEAMKKSQQIKLIKQMINAEDDKALCQLSIYPALINAKFKAFIGSQGKV
ncbi:uncharacterized protein IL334_004083 [Kwoniella shivajii]|uniref:RRM domain-containing protein n=1 Tax=Kwoniella shivajii TaxID=564305 RepID=A0ABZ1CZC4_9TREE|nr:hypothetical protein IL334_004083 [Kwoniella shivajii]